MAPSHVSASLSMHWCILLLLRFLFTTRVVANIPRLALHHNTSFEHTEGVDRAMTWIMTYTAGL